MKVYTFTNEGIWTHRQETPSIVNNVNTTNIYINNQPVSKGLLYYIVYVVFLILGRL